MLHSDADGEQARENRKSVERRSAEANVSLIKAENVLKEFQIQ
jgi:hypothetical protein